MHTVLYEVHHDIRQERINEILELIVLGKKSDEKGFEIGRDLIHHPKLLFLDELTL